MPRAENYFAAIDAHFLKAIYDSPKGAIRLAVLQRDLAPLLNQEPLKILDIGGGAGQMALWCAGLGHEVTLIDQSPPLLAKAQAAAQVAHLSLHCLEADALSLPPELAVGEFDLVLCHAVLEWVAQGEALFAACVKALKKGGCLSFMFYNRLALEFTQHVFGNFDYVDAGLKAKKRAKLTPDYPRELQWVQTQAAAQGLQALSISGIRCFYDYMKPKDREANTPENIIAHEVALSERAEFLPIARYIHSLWRKD